LGHGVFAFIGTLTGDQLFFFVGRYHGTSLLRRHPSWNKRAEKVNRTLVLHRILIIIGFRFLYGLRNVTPFVLGTSRVPISDFVILNIIGAATWASIIGILGFLFGHALELILGNIRHYEMVLLGVALLLGVLSWMLHLVKTIRRQQKQRR